MPQKEELITLIHMRLVDAQKEEADVKPKLAIEINSMINEERLTAAALSRRAAAAR